MSELTLRLRDDVQGRVDVTGVTPDAVGTGDPARLPIRIGRASASLGDAFAVHGATGTSIRFTGALDRVDGIGARCSGGTIVVAGPAGHQVGAGMTGGVVDVHGSVGDDAGLGMGGGTLRIRGSAGRHVGAAFPGERRGMTGGEIVVEGSIGEGAASLMRRGLVAVGDGAGAAAGRDMIAGTLLVLGRLGQHPGVGNKRGTIIALGPAAVPATYRLACVYQPAHVRLLMLGLRRRFAMALTDGMIAGFYRRYCGDVGTPGKGELLEWLPS